MSSAFVKSQIATFQRFSTRFTLCFIYVSFIYYMIIFSLFFFCFFFTLRGVFWSLSICLNMWLCVCVSVHMWMKTWIWTNGCYFPAYFARPNRAYYETMHLSSIVAIYTHTHIYIYMEPLHMCCICQALLSDLAVLIWTSYSLFCMWHFRWLSCCNLICVRCVIALLFNYSCMVYDTFRYILFIVGLASMLNVILLCN